MYLKEIVEKIGGRVLSGESKLDSIEIESAAASDLMSEVLAFAEPGMLLITGLVSPQVVRTAVVVGIPAILIVRHENVPEELVDLAKMNDLILVVTPLSMFEACGRLYMEGLKPVKRGKLS
ncbi:MAG: hypothetical protein DRP38_03810 [Thermotogae bacterium]|nr:MAG: hypothetical protein DRP38_03810 [Thermotogota bacterium]